MTEQEKFAAILERMKEYGTDLTPKHISVMVITGYLADMEDKGYVQGSHAMTPVGKNMMSICEEFEWKPSDAEVLEFVVEMVDPEDQKSFAYLIFKYRDDRVALLAQMEKLKKQQEEE